MLILEKMMRCFSELGFENTEKRRAPVAEQLVVTSLTTAIVASSTGGASRPFKRSENALSGVWR